MKLGKWLELPNTTWEKFLELIAKVPGDHVEELREKYNAQETQEENVPEADGDEELVPNAASRLFKGKKFKEACDKLPKLEDKGEPSEQASTASKELTKRLNTIFAPLKRLNTKAVNVALFGRMIAEIKDGAMMVDAACQVAHAISTHRVSMESDFFTAVEELKDVAERQGAAQDAGAGLLGNVDFNSACYYRYASLDTKELIGGCRESGKSKRPFGLHGDEDLAKRTAEAFLTAFVEAIPTGKKTSFAQQNCPSLVFATVRTGGAVSLANAFAKPVSPGKDQCLIEESIRALDRYYGRLTRMYGDRGLKKSAFSEDRGLDLTHLENRVVGIDQLIKVIVAAAFPGGVA